MNNQDLWKLAQFAYEMDRLNTKDKTPSWRRLTQENKLRYYDDVISILTINKSNGFLDFAGTEAVKVARKVFFS